MSSAPYDPLRGARAAQRHGFESVLTRTSSFSRAMAPQYGINRVLTISDRVDRATRSVMSVATLHRAITTHEIAAHRTVQVAPLGITDTFRGRDVPKAFQTARISDALRKAITVPVRSD